MKEWRNDNLLRIIIINKKKYNFFGILSLAIDLIFNEMKRQSIKKGKHQKKLEEIKCIFKQTQKLASTNLLKKGVMIKYDVKWYNII